MDHEADLKADDTVGPHMSQIQRLLEGRYSAQQVSHAYGAFRINAFAYSSPEGGEGRALFLTVALFSHSCR